MPQGPPYGSGPPWASGGRPPPGIPPAPPPTGYSAPRTGIYVGNSGPGIGVGSNSASSVVFQAAVGQGNGIVVVVNTSGGSTITVTDSAFNKYIQAGPQVQIAGTDVLTVVYCPASLGTNPLVTVSLGTARAIQTGYLEIVGANSQFFLDGYGSMGDTSPSGSTVPVGAAVTTYSPGDLIVAAFASNNNPSISIPAGYQSYLKPNLSGNPGQWLQVFAGGPFPAGTGGPRFVNPNGHNIAITITIRAAGVYPDHTPLKPGFKALPPWMKVPVIPFPYGIATTPITALGLTTTIGWGELDGAGALAALAVTLSIGETELDPALTAVAVSATEGTANLTAGIAALAVTPTEGTTALTGSGALAALALTTDEGTSQLLASGSLGTLALTIDQGTGQLLGAGALTALALTPTSGTADLEPLTGTSAITALGVTPSMGTGVLTGVGALGILGVTPTSSFAQLSPGLAAIGVGTTTGIAKAAGSGALAGIGLTVTTDFANLTGSGLVALHALGVSVTVFGSITKKKTREPYQIISPQWLTLKEWADAFVHVNSIIIVLPQLLEELDFNRWAAEVVQNPVFSGLNLPYPEGEDWRHWALEINQVLSIASQQ